MKNLIDSYLSNDRNGLLHHILNENRPEWSQRLYQLLTENEDLLTGDPEFLLANLYAAGLDKYPELEGLVRELRAEQTGGMLRADWPFHHIEEPLKKWRGHDDFVGGLVFLADGRLTSSSEDGWIRVWKPGNEEVDSEVRGHEGMPVNDLAYDCTRNLLVSCGDDFKIRLWNVDGGLQEVAVLEGHTDYVSRVAVHGDRLVSVSKDETVGFWNLEEKRLINRLEGHRGWVLAAAISPNGKQALTCAQNDSVIMWDLVNARMLRQVNEGVNVLKLPGMEHLYIKQKGEQAGDYLSAYSTAVWPSEDAVITADETIVVWKPDTWEEHYRLPAGPSSVRRMLLTGQTLIIIDRCIKGMNAGTGEELFEVMGHDGEEIRSAALAPDGNTLATADDKGMIHLRNLEQLLSRDYARGHSGMVLTIVPCGDEEAVTGSFDKTAIIWDLNKGQAVRRLTGHSDNKVNVFCPRPEAGEVITTSEGEVRVWNQGDASLLWKMKCDNELYGPDGLVATNEGYITSCLSYEPMLWEREENRVSPLNSPFSFHGDLLLSRDGRRLLASTFPDHFLSDKKEHFWRPIHSPLILMDLDRKKIIRKFWLQPWFTRLQVHEKIGTTKERQYPGTCAFSPGERLVAAGFTNGFVLAWDIASRKRLLKVRPFKGLTHNFLCWVDENTIAAVAQKSTELVLIDVRTGEISSRRRIASHPIIELTVSHDSRYWAWTNAEHQIGVYDLTEDCLVSVIGMPTKPQSICWHGHRLLVGGANGLLYSYSVIHGEVEPVQCLIENGADMNAPDEKGFTPLIAAAQRGHIDIAKYLLAKGADPNAADRNGMTPLIFAANRGHREIVQYLLESGAGIENPDNEGTTPLAFAVFSRQFGIVKLLVEHGAMVNAPDQLGITPLMNAAQWGHLDIARYLIEKGANPNAMDDEGRTALDYAEENGWGEVAKYLKSRAKSKANAARLSH